MKKQVKIDGIESSDKIITLLENSGTYRKNGEEKKNKYKIWVSKKDGTPTKAYQQFQKIRPVVGDILEMEVEEKDAEYNGFPYVDRTVSYFILDEHGTPPMAITYNQPPKPSPRSNSEPTSELEEKIRQAFAKRDAEIANLKKIIFGLQTLVANMAGITAVELHEALEDTAQVKNIRYGDQYPEENIEIL